MPTLARAHAAEVAVGSCSHRAQVSSALKPPCATILPRASGVVAIESSTRAAVCNVLAPLPPGREAAAATSSASTSTASSSTRVAASLVSTAGSSLRSLGAAPPAPPAASWRICSICASSISCSSRFCSSLFSRGAQRAPRAETSAWWREGSLLAECATAQREPKRAPVSARCSLRSGISERYMNASTAHRWTCGGTLASSSPRVAASSFPVGSMRARWSWCRRQTLASATHARARTFGRGERRKARRWRIGSSPSLSLNRETSAAACA
mmetsp:Transcript_13062/g.41754  ORF Transcript_13062/g.41754 Transcript_13062/m.41754 type:complete len:269 (-) Transcript_13062:487-1293(-)